MTTTLDPGTEAPTEEKSASELRREQASREELALRRVDDQDVDRIEVAFSGSVRLDRSDPADVALFRRLMLGKKAELRVELTVTGKHGRISWDEDGYPGETTAIAKARVTSLWRPVEPDGPEAKVGSDQLEITE